MAHNQPSKSYEFVKNIHLLIYDLINLQSNKSTCLLCDFFVSLKQTVPLTCYLPLIILCISKSFQLAQSESIPLTQPHIIVVHVQPKTKLELRL